MDLERFKKLPLMGIMRGIDPADIEPLIEVSAEAGLETLEITMNTPGAAGLIKRAVRISEKRLVVGAGTVLSESDLDAALEAGAGFIVTPVYIKEVVDACSERGIPFFPGALTPREVLEAWRCGAAMVKVFPANAFGPDYFNALKGPFGGIELMAVGGVSIDSIAGYFASGADAVAFGSGVFRKDLIDKKDFAAVGNLVEQYVTEVRRQVDCRSCE
jgi:2-dehydro-3-deoxyphosphogluconate aldolase / (4S)-4-hydroxy-2-oxoglutarate aldolase